MTARLLVRGGQRQSEMLLLLVADEKCVRAGECALLSPPGVPGQNRPKRPVQAGLEAAAAATAFLRGEKDESSLKMSKYGNPRREKRRGETTVA